MSSRHHSEERPNKFHCGAVIALCDYPANCQRQQDNAFFLQFPLTTDEMTLGNELEGRNVSDKGGEALKMAKTEASVSPETETASHNYSF